MKLFQIMLNKIKSAVNLIVLHPFFSILVIFFLSGCGGGGSNNDSSVQQATQNTQANNNTENNNSGDNSSTLELTGQFAEIFNSPASPLAVTINPDITAAQSGEIGKPGGKITVTTSDGTVYELVIPADALALREGETVTIKMTPVASIDDLPMSKGLIAAVSFEPENLTFFKPAVLTVMPSKPFTANELTGFAYQAEGQNFHLAPIMNITDVSYTVHISHFSGYGSGLATPVDTQQQGSQYPDTPEGRYQQAMATGGQEAFRKAIASGDGCFICHLSNETMELIQGYWPLVLEPMLANGLASDIETFAATVRATLIFLADLQSLGLDEIDGVPNQAELLRYLEVGAYVFSDHFHEECIKNKDHYVIQKMLNLLTQLQLTGSDEHYSAIEPEIDSRIDQCIRYTLDMDSNVSQGSIFDMHVKTPSPIKLTLTGSFLFRDVDTSPKLAGEGPYDVIDATFALPGCTVLTSASQGGQLGVQNVLFPAPDKLGTDLKVIIGLTPDSVSFQCDDSVFNLPDSPFFLPIFSVFHKDDVSQDFGGVVLQDWVAFYPDHPDLFARKVYGPRTGAEDTAETTEFNLRHAPEYECGKGYRYSPRCGIKPSLKPVDFEFFFNHSIDTPDPNFGN